MSRTKLTFDELYVGMVRLKGEYEIEHGGSTVPMRDKRRDDVEATLHELVHGVCLGNPHWAAEIEGRLPKAAEDRDAHEATVLRIEFKVLELLGHALSERKRRALVATATFDGRRPTFRKLNDPLTVAELALAQLTAGMIQRAARADMALFGRGPEPEA